MAEQRYSILEGFADLIRASRRVLHVMSQQESFDFPTEKDLEDFMLCTFPEEDASKVESVRRLWNPTFNAALDPIYKPGRDGGTAL